MTPISDLPWREQAWIYFSRFLLLSILIIGMYMAVLMPLIGSILWVSTLLLWFAGFFVGADRSWELYCKVLDFREDDIESIIKKHTERQHLVNLQNAIAEGFAERETVNKSDTKPDREQSKLIRGARITAQTKYNEMCRHLERDVSMWIYKRLERLERYKRNGVLPQSFAEEAGKLYLLLCDKGGRFNSRYVKMPKEWPAIGINAGLLEDLIVVLRTPGQIGLGDKHMYSLDELALGFRRFLIREVRDPDKTWESRMFPRFLFLTHLVDDRFVGLTAVTEANAEAYLAEAPGFDNVRIEKVITAAVLQQGNSKRIGVYKENGETFYYAIQGILGDVEFDARVTRVLTTDNCPKFAVHFTKQLLALNIWNKVETKVTKVTGRKEPIPLGAICRFERPVHALTNVLFEDGKYRIFNVDKDIRKRMAHGIRVTVERPKYQAGLVIDVPKLIGILPAGSVKQNEIGTLLVNGDIPHECLLHCIASEEDVEAFWSGTKS